MQVVMYSFCGPAFVFTKILTTLSTKVIASGEDDSVSTSLFWIFYI